MSFSVFTLLLTLAGTPSAGDIAPDFEARDTDGVTHRLDTLVKQGPVVLAFFSKAFTGG